MYFHLLLCAAIAAAVTPSLMAQSGQCPMQDATHALGPLEPSNTPTIRKTTQATALMSARLTAAGCEANAPDRWRKHARDVPRLFDLVALPIRTHGIGAV